MTDRQLQAYSKYFDALPIVCAIISLPDFKVEAATDMFIDVFHRTRKDTIGKNISEVLPDNPYAGGKHSESLKKSFKDVINSQETRKMGVFRYDIQTSGNRRTDFLERWWRATNSPILDDNHNVTHIVHIVDDINYVLDVLEEAQGAITLKLGVKNKSEKGSSPSQ